MVNNKNMNKNGLGLLFMIIFIIIPFIALSIYMANTNFITFMSSINYIQATFLFIGLTILFLIFARFVNYFR